MPRQLVPNVPGLSTSPPRLAKSLAITFPVRKLQICHGKTVLLLPMIPLPRSFICHVLIYIFLQFEKVHANRVISSSNGALPDDFEGYSGQYEYQPRPPIAKRPLISPELFKVLLNECNTKCWRRILPWHECIEVNSEANYLSRIPKKKGDFDVSEKGGERVAFGIEADYVPSMIVFAIYHLLAILPSFAFWSYWLAYHEGDWQNASVPLLTTVALITVFWITIGATESNRQF